MKYKLGATIPTVQYGNIMPEIELEGDNLEELKAQATAHIEEIWKQYGERPLTNNNKGGEVVKSFTGEELLYNDDTHSYYDMDGNRLQSGSYYASKLSKPFDKDGALIGSSNKHGVKKEELDKVWSLLGDTSREYGNAIHSALELYHRHHVLGAKVAESKEEEVNYAVSKLPHLAECVQDFVEKFGADAEVEILISDVKNGRAGQIDRLEVLDKKKKVCRIGDFKTNHTMTEDKLKTYQHQLSFYAHILKAFKWTVEGLDIYHYDGEKWTKTELEVLDLEE
jgi:hypothetical protein